nr:hypothetical protein [Kibdelosporangium sp. MJ126-NF4]CEL22917.1 hypothetical protein [Kibdelosporangium sp. MJ126-NF4]CTQ90057.1 hypothetical protein [Kibdelosporangium sp. MJ126-NF4]
MGDRLGYRGLHGLADATESAPGPEMLAVNSPTLDSAAELVTNFSA